MIYLRTKLRIKLTVGAACNGKNRLFKADNAFFTLIRALWHCFCCYFIVGGFIFMHLWRRLGIALSNKFVGLCSRLAQTFI